MKIRKALSLIAFFITLFCSLSVSASAHGEKRVYDNSNFISKDEAAEAYLAEFEEKTGVKIRIITTHDQYFALSEVGLNSGESAIILELIKHLLSTPFNGIKSIAIIIVMWMSFPSLGKIWMSL